MTKYEKNRKEILEKYICRGYECVKTKGVKQSCKGCEAEESILQYTSQIRKDMKDKVKEVIEKIKSRINDYKDEYSAPEHRINDSKYLMEVLLKAIDKLKQEGINNV